MTAVTRSGQLLATGLTVATVAHSVLLTPTATHLENNMPTTTMTAREVYESCEARRVQAARRHARMQDAASLAWLVSCIDAAKQACDRWHATHADCVGC